MTLDLARTPLVIFGGYVQSKRDSTMILQKLTRFSSPAPAALDEKYNTRFGVRRAKNQSFLCVHDGHNLMFWRFPGRRCPKNEILFRMLLTGLRRHRMSQGETVP